MTVQEKISPELGQVLALPNGHQIKNRFFKSAMSEGLSTVDNCPTENLVRLYDVWSKGGTGLLVTGNVMIDPQALGEPRQVVVEDERDLEMLKRWAQAATQNGNDCWVQLNHPGKQVPGNIQAVPVAPSAIPLGGGLEKIFKTPRALGDEEIRVIIKRFATSAAVVKKAGFSGVQIHGAHGYLLSQFLSPRHNQRDDQWGGSLQNRMRFALEVYKAIRAAVGPDFPVGIKLNSADFQRGGFTEEDSMAVVKALADAGIDLLEISGGTYEAPAMTGKRKKDKVKESTKQREAYFLDYAEKVRKLVDVPLVVTGGFRTCEAMKDALASGATDMIGVARPLAVEPDLPNRILAGEQFHSQVKPLTTGFRLLDKIAVLEINWYGQQLALLGKGKQPQPNKSCMLAFVQTLMAHGVQGFQRRRAKNGS
ncbi:MAG: NADH:flavin oxidoreductase/NADH oxidase family protein [Alteromonadaceae bacterium]|nr:NADH:flavin oxidoreductase/NADH oxidase family protein [Alteromonadaceae bacterium]